MNQTDIQEYIDNEVEESLTLDYKASDALAKTDGKKKEIAKDVSALANSAGGRIIYGVKEFSEPEKKHLPEKIDPVDRSQFSKEWLEQVINTIRPKVDGLVIHSVPIDTGPNDVVYVVEAPQSSTAHQARDFRYYKRYNFESVPMLDYEVRDVMGRGQYPKLDVTVEFEISEEEYSNGMGKTWKETEFHLVVQARNVGQIYAEYVNCFVTLPAYLLHEDELRNRDTHDEDGMVVCECYGDNTVRDVIDVEMPGPVAIEKYGPSRYDPILPGLHHELLKLRLNNKYVVETKEDRERWNNAEISWEIYADNALKRSGKVVMHELHEV